MMLTAMGMCRQVDTNGTNGMMSLPDYWFFGREIAVRPRDILRRYRLPDRR